MLIALDTQAGNSILHYAAQQGNTEALQKLIDCSGDVKQLNLVILIASVSCVFLLSLCLNRKAGRSLPMEAALQGHFELADTLLTAHGFDVNQPDQVFAIYCVLWKLGSITFALSFVIFGVGSKPLKYEQYINNVSCNQP